MKDELFVALQRLTPQHTLSRLVGALAASKNTTIKNSFIRWFANRYQPNMGEAIQEDPLAYASFNDFFTRPLKPYARPLASQRHRQAICCPADGSISQLGAIESGRIFQAKGQNFSVSELLASEDDAELFRAGAFATIYLSPKDYHRVHMPISGKLISMTHVPGRLYSVNPCTTERLPRLFARNERVVCIFETPAGKMAMVLVGAMIVASIETVWAGTVAPIKKTVHRNQYNNTEIRLAAGEEMGRFLLGSTVILLCQKNQISWDDALGANYKVKMGEQLGVWREG